MAFFNKQFSLRLRQLQYDSETGGCNTDTHSYNTTERRVDVTPILTATTQQKDGWM